MIVEIESFSGTVHVLVDVLDAQAKRIEHAKLKVSAEIPFVWGVGFDPVSFFPFRRE
jgi:hypothetical protein